MNGYPISDPYICIRPAEGIFGEYWDCCVTNGHDDDVHDVSWSLGDKDLFALLDKLRSVWPTSYHLNLRFRPRLTEEEVKAAFEVK